MENGRNLRKKRVGVVVSASMDKTRVVRVSRRVRHPLYGKEITLCKKYYVHDEENAAKVGDNVVIMEARPLSRLKRWRLVEILQRAVKKVDGE